MESLPVVLIPGLLASARLYASQLPVLWPYGPVTIATHTRDDSMAGIARRILADAPPRFALVGLSMGGYIAFEILRQEAPRVVKLALLDTQARADSEEARAARRAQMDVVRTAGLTPVVDALIPRFVHPSRAQEARLRALIHEMAAEVGRDGYLNQQNANMARPDSRGGLARIRCPTLVVVGDGDALTPPDLAREMAEGIPGARLSVIPECGHLSAIERPLAVNDALRSWLAP
ncbi:MAG TPA: alpha/beta fold hydrolase [Steroidobacteraceae bacterium]|jgi:pimeloyl-ACP methyl ester carboxylesterase|nr:alpha/beta fold hydrolase [Steroidobacteraceae bacterium]